MNDLKTGPGEYVGLPPLNSVEEIQAWLDEQGLTTDSLGTNFADQPLLLVRKGEGNARPIVITAGAHAGEPAGVLAALLLLRDYPFERPVYVVPLRDPFAWQGFNPALHYALGHQVPAITDHAGAIATLREHGEVLLSEDELLIVEIGGIAFAAMPPENPPIGPRQLEQAVNRALQQHPDLATRLLGKRIVFPSNSGPAEGVGNYERAFSATIRGEGIVADMNRGFGGTEEPAEVALLRNLVDELQPELVLDLHEGQGSTYYVFVSAGSAHAETYEHARAALREMGATGLPPVTLDDLERAFGPRIREGLEEPEPGMMAGRVQNQALTGTSFGNYCDRYGPSITLETGRWAPLAHRVQTQLRGARAILDSLRSSPDS